MKWINKETGKTFETDDINLSSMLEREGYVVEEEKAKQKPKK